MPRLGLRLGIGRSSSQSNWTQLLPQKLITTPAPHVEELDATTGWLGLSSATLALNTTEKYSSTGSIKLTGASATGSMKKAVVWDMSSDNGASLELAVYLHSVTTTVGQIFINVYTTALYGNYTQQAYNVSNLVKDSWVILKGSAWTVKAGTIDWSKVILIEVGFSGGTGIPICSFDLFTEGTVKKKGVLLFFDDGFISQYNIAYPLLRAKNMVATHYIISDIIGTAGYMSIAQLQTLNSHGHDIANHTKDSTDLTTLDQTEQEAEFNDCQTFLDSNGLSRASKHISYPFWKYDANSLLALAAWGGKTARKGPNKMWTDYGPVQYPYILETMYPIYTQNLAQMITRIDTALLMPDSTLSITFHKIVDADPVDNNDCLTSIFSGILDCIETLGLQTLTIDEYYRLYSGAITVHHK